MAKRKRKKLTENQLQYRKQVNRIKRAVRELGKQGYRFAESISDILPPTPSRITKKAIAKLAKITRAALREKATALSESGKVVTGTEAYQERRKESARKAAETRRRKKLAPQPTAAPMPTVDEAWLRKRELQDRIDLARANQFQEGKIIFQNFLDLIEMYPTKGAKALRQMLNSQLRQYGEEAVIRSLSTMPEESIRLAQEIVYYEASANETHRAIVELANMIRGSIATADEAKEISDLLEELDNLPELEYED